MASIQNRLPWLDNVKMIAMLCVIWGHMSGVFSNGMPGRLMGLIVAFNMPLFIFLSGFSALNGLQKIDSFETFIVYCEKIFWRICVPAVCFSAIDQALRGLLLSRLLWIAWSFTALCFWLFNNKKIPFKFLYKRKISIILKFFFLLSLLTTSYSIRYFWFLSTLIELQIASALIIWIIHYINQGYVRVWICSFAVWLLSFVLFSDWTFEMSFYFSLGLLAKKYEIIERIFSIPIWCSCLIFIFAALLCRYFTIDYGFYDMGLRHLIELGDHYYYIYILRLVDAILFFIPIISIVYKLSIKYNWFSAMGSQTLAFYMVHAILLDFAIKPFFYFDNNYMWIACAGATILLTAISYSIILMLKTNRLTKCVLLGDWR